MDKGHKTADLFSTVPSKRGQFDGLTTISLTALMVTSWTCKAGSDLAFFLGRIRSGRFEGAADMPDAGAFGV
jgi:hypothetical protein